MVWYSHLFKNFPQFVVIYTVKGFGIVNKGEVDVFLELSCFFNDPTASHLKWPPKELGDTVQKCDVLIPMEQT